MTVDLGSAIDPAWPQGDPTPYLEYPERRAELRAATPDLAPFFEGAMSALAGAPTLDALKGVRVALLGRERGALTAALAEVPKLPVDERKRLGKYLNLIRGNIEAMEKLRRSELESAAERTRTIDVTAPGRTPWIGHRHVLAQIRDELLDLFHGLGYSVYQSPEVEHDEYNFTKLNFPPDHPARDAHDTYFITDQVLLRTHTSPGWVRAMEEREPPLRLVFPGRTYRAEQVDASHMDQFHQIDGLFVARDVSMADLKTTLNVFARSILGPRVVTRLVPVFFPFVEPGCQLDVACAICGGTGRTRGPEGERRCAVCKGAGWSELLGAGMVHPHVFRGVGYDPEQVTGFAFGMGLERIAMARYGIPEIRLFLENDLRFLHQF